MAGGFGTDANRHGDLLAPGAETGGPTHVDVALVQVAPDALAGVIEQGHARGNPAALTASMDEPSIGLSVQDRLHDIGVTPIAAPVCAEAFPSGVQPDATLAPEDLVDAVVVDVDDRTHVTATSTRCFTFDFMFPAWGHVGVPGLDRHRPVGALCGDEYGLALNVSTQNEIAEGMARALIAIDGRPGPLADGFACVSIEAFQAAPFQAQGMFVVGIVDEPDFVCAIAVQIEREERGEPDSRNHSGAEPLLPYLFAGQRDDGQLHVMLREEEHLHVGIYLRILAVGQENTTLGAQVHRCRSALPQGRA